MATGAVRVLEEGRQIFAEMTGFPLTVRKKLGEGTQGDVYMVETPHSLQAVKWYKPEQATEEQKAAIRYLVRSGPPRGEGGTRFIWPLDLVTAPGSRQFGYLMPLIDTAKFAELGEVWAHLKPLPDYPTMCEISYQLANSYRALHLSGHCYRDISAGNLMFDPASGDALICDNDNVGVNRQSTCQVWGTIEYMAPEIIRGGAQPSIETDLHSLAVLLFYLWIWHHPMHGQMEYQFYCWDFPAKRRVYGEDPVFVFDPGDARNRLPDDPNYETARKRWERCPPSLKSLFIRAFTRGMHDPRKRVTEGEWQHLFLQLKDGAVQCRSCGARNLWDPAAEKLICWHCRAPVNIGAVLEIHRPGGCHLLLLNAGTEVSSRHLGLGGSDGGTGNVIGKVVENPHHPGSGGIRNLCDVPWHATFPDGSVSEVPPGKAVPLNPGTVLDIWGIRTEITRRGK